MIKQPRLLCLVTPRISEPKMSNPEHIPSSSEKDAHLSHRVKMDNLESFSSLVQTRMRSRKGRKIRPRKRILIEILEACRTPAIEHWIMIKARLGYETFWTHMNNLLKGGKMICSVGDRKRGTKPVTYYTITQEGLQMLENLKEKQDNSKLM